MKCDNFNDQKSSIHVVFASVTILAQNVNLMQIILILNSYMIIPLIIDE